MTLEQTVFTRVRIRLIPFMFVLYLVNYLDRVNIGFAALQMNKDLGFGPEAYGYGAGIFFWGLDLALAWATRALTGQGG